MKLRLTKKTEWNCSAAITSLKASLQHDKISIVKTDTVYGLLGALTKKSFNKIKEVKQRPDDKPYLILIASPAKLTHFVAPNSLTSGIKRLIEKCWPGPVTIIFKADQALFTPEKSFLISANQTIALRCPQHEGLQTLLPFFDGLFSTSANISGQPIPLTLEQIDPTLVEQVDLIVDDGTPASNNPSSIIDVSNVYCSDSHHIDNTLHQCTSHGTVTVVRRGSYSLETLERYYGTSFEQ